MRVTLVALAALWIAVLFNSALAANTTLLGGAPDLVCVAVVSIALLRGPESGALAGFVAGLGVDALTWQPLGLAALVYCLIGYGAGRVGEQLSDHAPLSPLIVVAFATLLARAGLVLLGFLLGSQLSVPAGASLTRHPRRWRSTCCSRSRSTRSCAAACAGRRAPLSPLPAPDHAHPDERDGRCSCHPRLSRASSGRRPRSSRCGSRSWARSA